MVAVKGLGDDNMKNKTAFALGVALMFMGTGTLATAYHIDYGATDNPADEWQTGLNLVVLCESTGSDVANAPTSPGADKVNPNPTPNHGEGLLPAKTSPPARS